MGRSLLIAGAAAAVFATSNAVAQDSPWDPSFYMETQTGQDDAFGTFYDPDSIYQDDNGGWVYEKDTFFGPDSRWSCNWTTIVSEGTTGFTDGAPGTIVDNEIVFTNLTDQYQRVTLTVTLPVGAMGPAVLMNGAVGMTVTNNDPFGGFAEGKNADQTGVIEPVYTGLIDGADVATLWPSDFSLIASGGSASASDSTDFDRLSGPEVFDNIGVTLTASISPGDTITITGLFEIAAVPAPAGLAVFAGLGLLGGRRRRG